MKDMGNLTSDRLYAAFTVSSHNLNNGIVYMIAAWDSESVTLSLPYGIENVYAEYTEARDIAGFLRLFLINRSVKECYHLF